MKKVKSIKVEWFEKPTPDRVKPNLEVVSVNYNAAEDGLPKKRIEKSDYD